MSKKITKEEKGRLDLLEKIVKDKNEVEVGEVAEIFRGVLGSYFDKTNSGKKVKEKLTEGEFVSFVTGFANSFLSSLYCSASSDEKELRERVETVEKANRDTLVAFGIGIKGE